MRRLLTLIVVSAGLVIPMAAAALPPPSVTGIVAAYSDGQVRVHWEPVQDSNVTFYRVYYSRRSILGSGGQYDDFETVDGKITDYIIKNPPNSDTFFISVLAVNSQLEESDYFAQEAKVSLSAGDSMGTTDPTVPATQSPLRREREANTLGLVTAEQVSSTETLLTFNHDVILTPEQGPGAFRIENGSGHELTLRRLVIQGSTVRVTSDPQKRGATYRVSVSAVVTGTSPAGATLPLDDSRSTATFTAAVGVDGDFASASSSSQKSVTGSSASSAASAQSSSDSASSADSGAGTLVHDLHLTGTLDSSGLWRVAVDWSSPLPPELLSAFIVRAEREDREMSLPAGERAVVFAGVKPGRFTASVRAVLTDGTSSAIQASVLLDKTALSNSLTKSGAGLALVFAASGGLAAWRRMKKGSRTHSED